MSRLLGLLDLSYNTSSYILDPQKGGLTDNLLKIVDQWEEAGQRLTGITNQEIVDALNSTYNLLPWTIDDINKRLDRMEQEMGFTTEIISGEVTRPIDEEIKPIQAFIPASQAWVITALTKAGNTIFDAIEAVTGDLANAINYIVHHVVDLSDEWIAN